MTRGDFVDDFIGTTRGLGRGDTVANVDWDAAVAALGSGRLPCSAGEGRLLRVAASLAAGTPVDLGEVLTGLDEANLALVVAAVWCAGGYRPVTSMAGARR